MSLLAETLVLLVACWLGWKLFRLCRLPAAAFLGPMVAAGAINFLYLYPDLPLDVPSFLSKVVIGMAIGRRLDRGSLAVLKELPRPALVTSIWMMAASLVAGFVLHAWTDLPLGTALIGSSAGGITEMVIFAMALGADVVTVAFIQLFRLVFSVLTVPLLARIWAACCRRRHGEDGGKAGHLTLDLSLPGFAFRHYCLLACSALAGGALFDALGVPAGAMIGSMCGTGLAVMCSGRICHLSHWFMDIAQFALGAIVARTMTHDTILALGSLFGPLFIPTLVLLVLCLVLSLILSRMTGWDDMTCILATMPAGLTQVAPIAEEVGADVLKVALLHTVRLFSIVAILPWIIRLLIGQ